MLRHVLLALVLLAVTGCGGGADPSSDSALTGPVTLERSGGIAGIQEQLVVAEDGTATFTSKRLRAREVPVSDPQLDALVTALRGWDAVPEDQRFDGQIADAIASTVTYAGHTVTTETSAEQDPRLAAVLAALGEIQPD